MLHADQPGAESAIITATHNQTVAMYVNDRIWAHTRSNERFRRFLDGSSLLASTSAAARPKLVEWYYTQTDALLEQASQFLTEETGRWFSRDEDWAAVHDNYSKQMAESQVCCRNPVSCKCSLPASLFV